MRDQPSRRTVIAAGAAATVVGSALPVEAKEGFQPSPLYLEYRSAFDAWVEVLEREPSLGQTESHKVWSSEFDALNDKLTEAMDALLNRHVCCWSDIAELGIVAHDWSWNRHAQTYCWQDCPPFIVGRLVYGILNVQAGDAVLHRRPPNWISPVRGLGT